MFCENIDGLTAKLESRGFTPHTVKNGAEAKALCMELIGKGSVGFGGSVTVDSLGIYDELSANGNPVFWHWKADKENRAATTLNAASADFFICSTNALTKDGVLVNIDGTGNRVSAMIAGPERTILVVGKNKLVADYDAAIARIKAEACPKNARRIGLSKLPCYITGKCANCASVQRMCRVTSIIEYKPNHAKEFHIILVDEELGY